MADHQKRRLLVVGGNNRRNVPPWLHAAFEVTHFESDETNGVSPGSSDAPDAIVVLSSWVSHKHFYDARDLAEEHDIPLILSPGGWSAAVQYAAEHGIEWFLADIEAAKESGEHEDRGAEIDAVIDNAWQEAYNREWAARRALERRYARDRKRFESALARADKAEHREAAAKRVVAEIREAARQQRELLEKRTAEVRQISEDMQQRNAALTACLTAHFKTVHSLLTRVRDAEQDMLLAAGALGQAREALAESMTMLTDALQKSNDSTAQPVSSPSLTTEADL